MRGKRRSVVFITTVFLVTAISALSVQADPVVAFIVTADSLATAGGDDALRPFVSDNEALVGAAVWQLLDIAFQVGEGGDKAAETENVDFARRVARIHLEENETNVPLGLVETYRSWTPAQRSTRTRANTLHEQADGLRGSEPDKAVEVYHQAMALYEEIDDRHSIAVVWGGLGVAHWYRGDMDAVEEHYDKALAARRAVDDRILEGRTLNGLGSVNLRKNEYADAIAYYSQAVDLRRRTGDLAGLGTSITYLGHVYFQLNRLVDARDQYEEALPILEAQGKASAMVDVLNGIANCYSEMGRIELSNETYRRGIAAAQAAGEPEKEIPCRGNLADNYRRTGKYVEALAELDTTAAVLDANPDPRLEAMLCKYRGLVYMDAGMLDQSRDDLVRAVELTESLGEPESHVESLIYVGYLYLRLGAYDRGLRVGGQAKVVCEENGFAAQYREAVALIGEMYRLKGDNEAALEYWGEALAQDEYDEMTMNILESKLTIASIRAVSGETEAARQQLYDVWPLVKSINAEMSEIGVLFALGHTFENENPDSAAYYYEAGLALVERSRASFQADEARSGFLSGERRLYFEEVARYYASLGGDGSERGFVTVERAKARGLLDLLAMSEATATSEAEEEILDELYRLDPAATDYESHRARLQAQYEQLREDRMKERVGSLAQTGSIAGIEDVRKALPKNTVMLQYALGDTTSLLWVVDRKGHDLVTLPNRAKLRPEVDRFRDAVAQPGRGDAALVSSARALYELLVAPAGERAQKAEHLVVVPDGFLHEVPFDALLTADSGADTEWKEQPFLAKSFSTVYAPSASIYLELKKQKTPKYELDLVAFGDPDYSLIATGDGGPSWGALPYARAEVEAISGNVKDNKRDVRLGADAHEAALKQQMNEGSSRVLHLATHGLVNPVEPSASSVVLCPDPARTEDGYLRTMEILSASTDAGVVVVSACESALGRVSRGEGVVGLSRAFIASGAGSVVASLWAVSDESTSELMKVFYAKMIGKKRPAGRAMREARMSLIDGGQYSHPFYWSPFIVIGTDKSPW